MENCLALWAKKKEKDGIFYWLSLKRHLEEWDVVKNMKARLA